MTNAALLDLLTRSDEESFGRLYDLTAGRVYGTVLQLVADPRQAAEATKTTYLKALRLSRVLSARNVPVLPWLLLTACHQVTGRRPTANVVKKALPAS